MQLDFTDWYWLIGGNGPHTEDGNLPDPSTLRLYSTKQGKFVSQDDPAYLAWIEKQSASMGAEMSATRIDTPESLTWVLTHAGLEPNKAYGA